MKFGIICLSSVVMLAGLMKAVRVSEGAKEYPYNDDGADTDDVMVSLKDMDLLEDAQGGKPKGQDLVLSDESIDDSTAIQVGSQNQEGASSGNKSQIEEEAEAFVDSDETLNAQMKAEESKKLPTHSGYPYVD